MQRSVLISLVSVIVLGQTVLQADDAKQPKTAAKPAVKQVQKKQPVLLQKADKTKQPQKHKPAAATLGSDVEYYTTSPAQGRPADGRLPAGTKVKVLEKAGSYVRVMAVIEAYVPSDSLKATDKPGLKKKQPAIDKAAALKKKTAAEKGAAVDKSALKKKAVAEKQAAPEKKKAAIDKAAALKKQAAVNKKKADLDKAAPKKKAAVDKAALKKKALAEKKAAAEKKDTPIDKAALKKKALAEKKAAAGKETGKKVEKK